MGPEKKEKERKKKAKVCWVDPETGEVVCE